MERQNAGEVISFYYNMVYRLAFARTGRREDAEEITQEVFLRFLRKAPEFDSEEHRKAWLLRVTVNCCNSALRSFWHRQVGELTEEIPFEDFEEKEDLQLYRELQKLPERYRQVIHLFYYEELTVAEIGKLLHRKEATIRTQLTRARAMLKEVLGDDYVF